MAGWSPIWRPTSLVAQPLSVLPVAISYGIRYPGTSLPASSCKWDRMQEEVRISFWHLREYGGEFADSVMRSIAMQVGRCRGYLGYRTGCQMAASMQDSPVFVDTFNIDAQLFLALSVSSRKSWPGRYLYLEIVAAYLLNIHGLLNVARPHHHGIHTVFVERPFGLFRDSDVAVPAIGICSVRFSSLSDGVQSASPVYICGGFCHGWSAPHTAVLQPFRKVGDNQVVIVHPRRSDRYRQSDGFDHLRGNFEQQWNILQTYPCTAPLPTTFTGQTEVEVITSGRASRSWQPPPSTLRRVRKSEYPPVVPRHWWWV